MQHSVVKHGNLRDSMAEFTTEAAQTIDEILSNADFKSDFPNIFGNPDELGDAVTLLNQSGLLLYKALLHTKAAIVANQRDNLHSLAVQLRVVLECASPLVSMTNAIVEGGTKEAERIANITDSEAMDWYRRVYKGEADDDILRSIRDVRQSLGMPEMKAVSVNITNTHLKHTVGGPDLYRFLSNHFCKRDPKTVTQSALVGGIVQPSEEDAAFAFGYFLDFLAGLLGMMLLSHGAIVILVDGTSQSFDDALEFRERKRKAAQSFGQSGKGD